ncbi:hypothetical protein [Nonomuraea lactucae]|uniref:hypothetical protein n=1 Tax=Nonomuraea lactucae TaxID=2249762 RepID=UPI000DE36CB1|nr:hypothetical protein [Nonomuraea lactucae]
MTTKDVTDADVRAAERQAATDAEQVETLKQRLTSGENISPDELAQARQLAEWSELRVLAVRQQCEQTTERKRQEACAQLGNEIRAGQTELLAEIIAELRAMQQHEAAYLAKVDAYNANLSDWRTRMQQLRVPEHNGTIAPPAAHSRLGWSAQGDLFVGRRRIARIDPGMHLTAALEAGRAASQETHINLHLRTGEAPVPLNHPSPDTDPYDRLAALDDDTPEPTAKYFYRGSGGAPIATDHPYSPEDIKRLGLRVITREEAWPE